MSMDLRRLLITVLIASPGIILGDILVDTIHGHPVFWSSNVLEELLPDVEFDYLYPDMAVITDTLFFAVNFTPTEWEIPIQVPAGRETLILRYIAFDHYEHIVGLENPQGDLVANEFNSLAYVTDPEPGTWNIHLFGPTFPVNLLVGTGPQFFTADVYEGYDAVVQIHNNQAGIVYGIIDDFTDQETAYIYDYLLNGGGYLFFHEPVAAFDYKPVVRLYSDVVRQVDVSIQFPGVPKLLEPEIPFQYNEEAAELRWKMAVEPEELAEILYEGQLPGHLNYLSAELHGNEVQLLNHASFQLSDVTLFRHVPGGFE